MGSLPKSLSFPRVKSNAVASVSSSYTCTPINSAQLYQPGQIISFDIPCGIRSQWLDPSQTYLQFTVAATLAGGTSPTWTALPHFFIQSAALYSSAGSKSIEALDQYSNAHTVMRDIWAETPSVRTSDTITMNADPTKLRVATVAAATDSVTYALPLVSLVGLISAADVMIPTFALGSPLRLDLVLSSAAQALTVTGGPTTVSYSITAPKHCYVTDQLDDRWCVQLEFSRLSQL